MSNEARELRFLLDDGGTTLFIRTDEGWYKERFPKICTVPEILQLSFHADRFTTWTQENPDANKTSPQEIFDNDSGGSSGEGRGTPGDSVCGSEWTGAEPDAAGSGN